MKGSHEIIIYWLKVVIVYDILLEFCFECIIWLFIFQFSVISWIVKTAFYNIFCFAMLSYTCLCKIFSVAFMYLFILCVYMCVSSYDSLLIWTSEDSLRRSGLSFHNVGPRNINKVVSFAASSFTPRTSPLTLWSTYY